MISDMMWTNVMVWCVLDRAIENGYDLLGMYSSDEEIARDMAESDADVEEALASGELTMEMLVRWTAVWSHMRRQGPRPKRRK